MDSGAPNSATVPYIGSKISLVSNVDIRYEGILYSINTLESTVALQNVRAFGTEGRKIPEVPPSNKTFQFIIFKGHDIKDLTVCEPAATRIPDDPAVVSVNVPPKAPSIMPSSGQNQMQSPMGQPGGNGMMRNDVPNRQNYGANGRVYGMSGANVARPSNYANMPPHVGQGQMPGYPQQPQGGGMMMRHHDGNMFGYGGRGGGDMYPPRGGGDRYGGHMLSGDMDPSQMMGGRGRYGGSRGRGARRIVGELPPQPNQAVKKEVSKAFDFEESNAKFDKSDVKTENVVAENGENTNAADKSTKKIGYDKTSSFFDRISCETLDRQAGQESRVDRDKQRQLDCETFGDAAASAPRGRGYRRGYGRGGRQRGGGYDMNRSGGRYGGQGSQQQMYMQSNPVTGYAGGPAPRF